MLFKLLLFSSNAVIFIALLTCGTLSFVIRDASSLHIFKKNLNKLYLTMVNLFDVNSRCTWSLACVCVNCDLNYLCNLNQL